MNKEELKSNMLERIRNGGAWFSTGQEEFVKIGHDETDDQYYARECFFRDGELEGGAYTFGTDWFDISFHGRRIDIYVDPDTFKSWKVWYEEDRGTCMDADEARTAQGERVLNFSRQADQEAMTGLLGVYQISGTNFDKIIR